MNAIEFSQQKELMEVIKDHVKKSAVYCFGKNETKIDQVESLTE